MSLISTTCLEQCGVRLVSGGVENMKKDIRGNILLVAVMCMLSGCAKTPEAEEENGIRYAFNENDESIRNMIENDTENVYWKESEEGNKCVCSIGDSGHVMNINAVIDGVNLKTISTETAEPFPDAVNVDKVIDLLFGGKANVIEGKQKEDNTEQQNSGGEPAVMRQMKTTGEIALDSVDGKIHFNLTSHAGFDYRNDSLLVQYKQIEAGGNYFEESDKDISDSYTIAMAKQDLMEIFSYVLNTEIQIVSCTSLYNETGDGFYEFHFVPVIGKLPVAINDREMNTDNIVDVYGRAQIGKDGIAVIEATNLLWNCVNISNESERSCLGLEKALEILEEYIKKGEISCSEKITFTRVSLVWLPITDDWTKAELVPVWRFYIPCAELIESGMSDISLTENAATDICINAINGKIENIQ